MISKMCGKRTTILRRNADNADNAQIDNQRLHADPAGKMAQDSRFGLEGWMSGANLQACKLADLLTGELADWAAPHSFPASRPGNIRLLALLVLSPVALCEAPDDKPTQPAANLLHGIAHLVLFHAVHPDAAPAISPRPLVAARILSPRRDLDCSSIRLPRMVCLND